ncbi:hypothetical protein [Kitasatospora phosalacinea]|uniref:Uncharacterized protein n=1 Tax=Kitasatospora phosalacinea TaxID=2065 RepID=A0A9W6PL17_9ACTN|nr:hypothetical protein [Kitasatospora phosalacinea]GLW56807.1 hypothetical protein Kpho01_48180 [Kitasatospora phosalacinea]
MTHHTSDPRRPAAAYEPAIKAISELEPGQVRTMTLATGTGKTLALAAAVHAFLLRHPGARVLVVTHPLTVTQHAEALAGRGVPVTAIRDQGEMRAWLFHSTDAGAPAVVVARNLIGSIAQAHLRDTGFALAILEDAAHYLPAVTDLITSGDTAVVVTGHPAELQKSAQALRHSGVRAIQTPTFHGSLLPPADLRMEVVHYRVSPLERALINDAAAFYAQWSRAAGAALLRTAAESRAAFSTALLGPRLERLAAAGAHGSRSGRFHGSGGFPEHSRQDSLFDVEAVVAAIPDEAVDDFLDRIDDLGPDDKLLTLLKLISEDTENNQRILLFVRSSATAEYVRQFLAENIVGAIIMRGSSLRRDDPDQLSIFSSREFFIVADGDLPYLGSVSTSYRKIWFDLPSSTPHGLQRKRFSESEAGSSYLLWPDPPLAATGDALERLGIQPVG